MVNNAGSIVPPYLLNADTQNLYSVLGLRCKMFTSCRVVFATRSLKNEHFTLLHQPLAIFLT